MRTHGRVASCSCEMTDRIASTCSGVGTKKLVGASAIDLLLDDQWAAGIANGTTHGIKHIGWGPDETGGYRGQMAACD